MLNLVDFDKMQNSIIKRIFDKKINGLFWSYRTLIDYFDLKNLKIYF